MQLERLKIDFPVYLAPMAGISDVSFRTLMREMGAGVVVTELLSSEAMVRMGQRTLRMMRVSDQEHPVGVQLFGSEPKVMAESAKIAEGSGADFIDINLGCPVRKIVCQGAGAALLTNPKILGEMLLAIRESIKIPLTVKMRTGFDASKITVHETIQVAFNSGVSAVAIHGRTRAQAYEGRSDWELIAAAKASSPLPVIGNGDLVTAVAALRNWQESKCDGIMIGRGALRNPWIFLELLTLLNGKDISQVQRDPFALMQRHVELLKFYEEPRQGLLQLKKFLAWYAAGMHGASQFRTKIFQINDFNQLISAGMEFFASQELITGIAQGERFLMGGHG